MRIKERLARESYEKWRARLSEEDDRAFAAMLDTHKALSVANMRHSVLALRAIAITQFGVTCLWALQDPRGA